ncbi:hypothetical protein GCM10022241_17670 [Micrococcus endophyticus]
MRAAVGQSARRRRRASRGAPAGRAGGGEAPVSRTKVRRKAPVSRTKAGAAQTKAETPVIARPTISVFIP